jgi:hypothetical protein
MALCQLFKDTTADQQNKVADLSASASILIAERVENDTAVDVDVATEGVSLQGVSSVDYRRVNILLFLFCFLLEEYLIILEVF